ncbi:transglycosylase domain-containing protein [Laceyella putida]|uniref:Transglycosylase domain-containing protein n=1 Tax=Laceyella putida TaxID=110101 RepID=A0ABW2RMF1_9BACL
MDDFRKVSMKSGYSPMPPRTRSERAGSRSRSGRSSGGGPRGSSGRRPPKQGWQRFFTWKWFMLILLTSLLLMVGGCAAIMASADMYDLKEIDKANMPLSSKILDQKGNVVATFGFSQREWADMKQMRKVNPMLPDAFVKVEDRRFYEHNGVDFEGLARAVVKNIVAMGAAQGASTITQQVCKNIVLKNPEKTMTRKVQELGCALNLERKASKEDILAAYLNYIPFGGDIAGVRMASKVYFDKDPVKDHLEPEEVAMLAGMPKAPSTYNPVRHPEKAKERRDVVLTQVFPVDDVMKPFITQEEANKLAEKPLKACEDCRKKYAVKDKYQAFKDLVKTELKNEYDVDPEDLANKGYEIHTKLNVKAQDAVEKALKDDSMFVNNNGEQLKDADAGITILDPKTGLIVASGGGRQYNAASTHRGLEIAQPGSTIKPLTVFGPAVYKHDYNEFSMLNDRKIDFRPGWNPKNFTPGEKGDVPMAEAVKKSLNLSTIHLLHDVVKLDPAFEFGNQLGLKLQEADKDYAPLALGALNKGVNTVQMAQAYQVFVKDGSYHKAHAIVKVMDGEDELKPKTNYKETKKVFDAKTAWWMTRMMKKVIFEDGGTGHNAKLEDGRDVAGKSGTVQGEKGGWFVGYTPDLVAAVNVWYPTGGEIVKVTGGSAPAKIFSYVMSAAHEGIPPHQFEKPEGVKDPSPPFQLQAPQLSGRQEGKKVVLHWQQQNERVKYQILRSEGNGQFTPVGEAGPGSTGWEDTTVQVPEGGGGGFFDFIGGGGDQKKVYMYKVIAIDTQQPDPALGQKDSNVITVEVKGEEKKVDDQYDKNKDGIDDRQQDTDGDRVNDYEDKFPNDPTKTGKEQDNGGDNGGIIGGGDGDQGGGGRPGNGDQGDNGGGGFWGQ